MQSGILILLIIASGLAGVLIFFLIRHLSFPRKIKGLQEQLKKGRITQAIRDARIILKKDPGNLEAHYLLGQAYMREGNHKNAMQEYSFISNSGQFPEICRETEFRQSLADLYLLSGQESEALKEFLLLTKLEPYKAEHFYNAGHLLKNRGKSDSAAKYLKQALNINPRYSDAWFEIGELFYNSKKFSGAKEAFQRALKLRPDNYKVHFYMGKLLQRVSKFSSALASFEQASKDPDYKTQAIIERGICYLYTKNYTSAQMELERVLRLNKDSTETPDMLIARYYLSVCYEKARNIDKAITQWKIIQKYKPNFRDIAEKLRKYNDLCTDDSIKDFITENPKQFEQTCRKIAETLGFLVVESKEIPDGYQLVVEPPQEDKWKTPRRFPKLLRVIRSPKPVELSSVREFHEQIKKLGGDRGFYIASSEFTRSATNYTQTRPIDIIAGPDLQKLLKEMQEKV
ncbi:MAG: hypothetical protein CSA76_01855 [Spirochaetales bacterium]|nr:MAG: hypothetical protein CSA76_01855 [Spirochaetales bacterium]